MERVERIGVVLLIKFMILTFTWVSLDPRIWSCRRAAIDSMERQDERMFDQHYARLRLVRQQGCFENHPKMNGSRKVTHITSREEIRSNGDSICYGKMTVRRWYGVAEGFDEGLCIT